MARPDTAMRLGKRDLERLQHASELLDAAHDSLMKTSLQAKEAIGRLLYEAQQEILHPLTRIASKLERWNERHATAAAAADGEHDPAEPV